MSSAVNINQPRVLLFDLFRLYVTFDNLSVMSRQCLDVAGSSIKADTINRIID